MWIIRIKQLTEEIKASIEIIELKNPCMNEASRKLNSIFLVRIAISLLSFCLKLVKSRNIITCLTSAPVSTKVIESLLERDRGHSLSVFTGLILYLREKTLSRSKSRFSARNWCPLKARLLFRLNTQLQSTNWPHFQ